MALSILSMPVEYLPGSCKRGKLEKKAPKKKTLPKDASPDRAILNQPLNVSGNSWRKIFEGYKGMFDKSKTRLCFLVQKNNGLLDLSKRAT